MVTARGDERVAQRQHVDRGPQLDRACHLCELREQHERVVQRRVERERERTVGVYGYTLSRSTGNTTWSGTKTDS